MFSVAIRRTVELSAKSVRTFHLAPVLRLKEIKVTKKNNETIIEGVHVKSPREGKVVESAKEAHDKSCALCRLNLKRLKYTDVLILSQFIEPDGSLMEWQHTGLCGGQYKLVRKLVQQAQLSQLLPRPADFESYGPWDNLKTYHEWPPRYRDQPMRQVQPEYWKKSMNY
ncbi:28S ribosomal protein S18a, mitochondrial [Halotydeus destructor]|nr:28S ribosomal protein S18a, mitochondrial [Halotydeus destructor]